MKKITALDVIASIIIVACFVFMWNAKDGVIVAIQLTVVSYYFGDIYKRFGGKDKE